MARRGGSIVARRLRHAWNVASVNLVGSLEHPASRSVVDSHLHDRSEDVLDNLHRRRIAGGRLVREHDTVVVAAIVSVTNGLENEAFGHGETRAARGQSVVLAAECDTDIPDQACEADPHVSQLNPALALDRQNHVPPTRSQPLEQVANVGRESFHSGSVLDVAVSIGQLHRQLEALGLSEEVGSVVVRRTALDIRSAENRQACRELLDLRLLIMPLREVEGDEDVAALRIERCWHVDRECFEFEFSDIADPPYCYVSSIYYAFTCVA